MYRLDIIEIINNFILVSPTKAESLISASNIIAIANIITIIIFGILTFKTSKRLKEVEEKNSALNETQTELQIITMISESKRQLIAIFANKKSNKSIKAVGIEIYLNAISIACIKYKNKEINRDKFKEIYFYEIEELFKKGSPYKKNLDSTNAYKSIHGVYNEWFKGMAIE
ncbi:hypothetical protein ACNSOO_04625 [Aliarcobacter lanthieri]|uniref:hypothetical protein n=1 Tax=Aliarcobacter lanthieri TaxID=1355374 RepID=UPI003AAE42E5